MFQRHAPPPPPPLPQEPCELWKCTFQLEDALSVHAMYTQGINGTSTKVWRQCVAAGLGAVLLLTPPPPSLQKQSNRRILMYGHAILLRHISTKKVSWSHQELLAVSSHPPPQLLRCLSTSPTNDKLAYNIGFTQHTGTWTRCLFHATVSMLTSHLDKCLLRAHKSIGVEASSLSSLLAGVSDRNLIWLVFQAKLMRAAGSRFTLPPASGQRERRSDNGPSSMLGHVWLVCVSELSSSPCSHSHSRVFVRVLFWIYSFPCCDLCCVCV